MALGFNNYPINFQSFSANQDRSGEFLVQGIQGLSAGLEKYRQRQRDKKENEAAASALRKILPALGAPPEVYEDEKAITALTKDVGAANVLQFGAAAGELQREQQMLAARKRELSLELERRRKLIQDFDKHGVGTALANYDGPDLEGAADLLSKAGGERRAEADARRDAESHGVDLERTKQLTEESKARTDKMKSVEEQQYKLGQVIPIEGTPGTNLIVTGPNSGQLRDENDNALTKQQEIAALARAVDKDDLNDYYNKTRDAQGNFKPRRWWVGGDGLNPLYEMYFAKTGVKSFYMDDDGEIKQGGGSASDSITTPSSGGGMPDIPVELQGVL